MSVWVANLGCLGVGPGVPVSFDEQNKDYLPSGRLNRGAAGSRILSSPSLLRLPVFTVCASFMVHMGIMVYMVHASHRNHRAG